MYILKSHVYVIKSFTIQKGKGVSTSYHLGSDYIFHTSMSLALFFRINTNFKNNLIIEGQQKTENTNKQCNFKKSRIKILKTTPPFKENQH